MIFLGLRLLIGAFITNKRNSYKKRNPRTKGCTGSVHLQSFPGACGSGEGGGLSDVRFLQWSELQRGAAKLIGRWNSFVHGPSDD